MNFKKIFLLIILVLIVILGLYFTFSNKYYTNKSFNKLFINLEESIDKVSHIEIENNINTVYLFNEKGTWSLPNYYNYPASDDKIRKFLLNTLQLKTVDKKTNNPDLHNKLGLAYPLDEESFRVRLLNENKDLLSDFIIGKTFVHNNELSYVRKFNDNQSWLFKNNFNYYKDEIEWSEDSILKIARWRIKSVNITSKNDNEESIFIYKKKHSDQSFSLKDIPNNYTLNDTVSFNEFASLLESIKKTNIRKLSSLVNAHISKKIIFTTFDGLIIKISEYRHKEEIFYHFDVSSDISIRDELPKDELKNIGLPNMKTFDEVTNEEKNYEYLKKWVFSTYNDFITILDVSKNSFIKKK